MQLISCANDASFLTQSQRAVKQNKSNPGYYWDTELITALLCCEAVYEPLRVNIKRKLLRSTFITYSQRQQ